MRWTLSLIKLAVPKLPTGKLLRGNLPPDDKTLLVGVGVYSRQGTSGMLKRVSL